MSDHPRIELDGEHLALESVARVASGACPVRLLPAALARVGASRAAVEKILASGEQVYGVNTGFGHLKDVRIPADQLEALQVNLIRSHAAGVGSPLPPDATRALMLLRAHLLARGYSGVRPLVIETLIAVLNSGILPIVPEQGSVGASGDLAPLSHLVLTLIGEGEAILDGARVEARKALSHHGIAPLRLAPKEGIALINGTQMITAVGVLAVLEAEEVAAAADIVGACSIEALKGSHHPFEDRVHRLRPHPGQIDSAASLRAMLADSEIARSHDGCGRVQDAYSLRCLSQVHGAAREGIRFARRILETEVDAVTDNPIVFPDRGDLLSGGNFHGQTPALALDALAIAVASLASISERRIDRLMNPAFSGLPAFLTRNPGVHSGLMMAQVTAAALVSENKGLCHPASVDSIPTEAGQEDHVSMGPIAARKARRVVAHARQVIAIELLAACQALDFLAPLKAGRGVEAARRAARDRVAFMDEDRFLAPDLAALEDLIRGGTLRAAVEAETGGLR
jgi:histidine ammonia-lyase